MQAVDTPPRRILFAHSSDDIYGSDGILLNLVLGLDKRRYQALVVLPTDVPQPGQLGRALREQGIETVGLDMAILRRRFFTPTRFPLFLWRLLRSTLALRRLMRQHDIDLVHSHTAAVLPAALAARLAGRPHVWQTLEIIDEPRFLWRVMSWMLPRFSRRIVAASGPTRDHLLSGNSACAEKTQVIHYGLDTSRFQDREQEGRAVRAEWGFDADDVVIGMTGRLHGWKGQDLFLQMAAQVAAEHQSARFVLVGETVLGNEVVVDELRDLTRQLGLEQRVVFAGLRQDIPAVAHAFDIAVLPSTRPDPFPTVVLEAMAAGRPVVAVAHGGSVEMVDDGVTGRLVEPGRPDALAAAVGELVRDEASRRRMGQAGEQRLAERFTLQRFVQAWEQVYDSVGPTS
jgi:glycosyltransferase involved in cell wall biosynthesis